MLETWIHGSEKFNVDVIINKIKKDVIEEIGFDSEDVVFIKEKIGGRLIIKMYNTTFEQRSDLIFSMIGNKRCAYLCSMSACSAQVTFFDGSKLIWTENEEDSKKKILSYKMSHLSNEEIKRPVNDINRIMSNIKPMEKIDSEDKR